MKAEELMVNDWVSYEGAKCKVAGFLYGKCEVTFTRIGETIYDVPLKYILPIPLTREILEKNGWRYNDAPFVQGWEQYGITIINNRITCGQNVSMKVEFVHELQHALKLCAIELEIKL